MSCAIYYVFSLKQKTAVFVQKNVCIYNLKKEANT